MDRRGAWDALCIQLSHQAGKNVDLLWECDMAVQGTIVWLNGNSLPEKYGDDGSQRKQDIRKLFVVNEATSGRLLLEPVVQQSGVVGATCLTRADALKLHLATQDDFLGDRISEVMFIWLVSRLQSQDLKWSPKGLKSRSTQHTKPSVVNPNTSSLPKHSKALDDEPQNFHRHKEAHIGSGTHGCQDAGPRKKDAVFEPTGLAVHGAGSSAAHVPQNEGTRPAAPAADAQATKHLKWTKATDGVAGVGPHLKALQRHKPFSLPKSSSNAVKKVPAAKKRINAAKKRMREQLDPAKVHERKEKQKQSFLTLPEAETEAVDLPSMRHPTRQ